VQVEGPGGPAMLSSTVPAKREGCLVPAKREGCLLETIHGAVDPVRRRCEDMASGQPQEATQVVVKMRPSARAHTAGEGNFSSQEDTASTARTERVT
jgi:hypothetical protein